MHQQCTFQARVYNCMRGFQVPWPIARSLRVWGGNTLQLVIKRGKRSVFKGRARLTSGTEVRSGAAVKGLRKGELIRVIASRV